MEGSIYKECGNVLDSRYGVGRDEREEWRKFNSDLKQHRLKRERNKFWWVMGDQGEGRCAWRKKSQKNEISVVVFKV